MTEEVTSVDPVFKAYADKITQVIKDSLDFIKLEYDTVEVNVHQDPTTLVCKWMVRPKGTEGMIGSSFAFKAEDNLDEARGAILFATILATHPMGNIFNYMMQVFPMFQVQDPGRNSPIEVLLRAEIFRLNQMANHPDMKKMKDPMVFNRINAAGILATSMNLEQNLTEFFKNKIEVAKSLGQLRHLPKR
jgi:hypothetical protein